MIPISTKRLLSHELIQNEALAVPYIQTAQLRATTSVVVCAMQRMCTLLCRQTALLLKDKVKWVVSSGLFCRLGLSWNVVLCNCVSPIRH